MDYQDVEGHIDHLGDDGFFDFTPSESEDPEEFVLDEEDAFSEEDNLEVAEAPHEPPAAAPSPSKKPNEVKKTSSPNAKSNNADETVMGRVFAQTKAGMDGSGLSVEEQKRIVHEVTKDSKFFLQQKKQDDRNTASVNALKVQVSKLTEQQLAGARKIVDKKLQEMEEKRDLSKTIVCLDMDAFYCSVEERDDPSLKSIPFAVGMQAANYEARKYGVRSGMAGFVAKALCPHIKILRGDMSKYVGASKEVKAVLMKYVSQETELSMASIDEAFLDITRYMKDNNMTASEVVQMIREDVFNTTRLTCSAGIAPVKPLAKVASNINKPNGQYEVAPDREVILNFYRNLNIRQVQGIGAVAERFLREVLEIHKINDLGAKLPHLQLIWPTHVDWYCSVYLGLGSNVVVVHHDAKSVGSETTFRALGNVPELFELLKSRCESVAKELQENNWKGRCLTLVCKRSDFQRFSRQQHLLMPVNELDEIYPIIRKLLEKEFRADPQLKLRLIGARATKLSGPGTDGGTAEEETAADKAKQKRIDDFVGDTSAGPPQAAPAKEAVRCPVCGTTFEADVASVVVTSHVNKCLDKDTQKSPQGNKRPRSGEASKGPNTKKRADGQQSILGFFGH